MRARGCPRAEPSQGGGFASWRVLRVVNEVRRLSAYKKERTACTVVVLFVDSLWSRAISSNLWRAGLPTQEGAMVCGTIARPYSRQNYSYTIYLLQLQTESSLHQRTTITVVTTTQHGYVRPSSNQPWICVLCCRIIFLRLGRMTRLVLRDTPILQDLAFPVFRAF